MPSDYNQASAQLSKGSALSDKLQRYSDAEDQAAREGVASRVKTLTYTLDRIANLAANVNQGLGGRMSQPQVDTKAQESIPNGLPERLTLLISLSANVLTNLEEADEILHS